jgi:predicted DNA binding CopG/RHH family protein
MRDYQIWLYVIIGIIYLLGRFFKKTAAKPEDLGDAKPEKPAKSFDLPTAKPTASGQKMLTFEELLKEITESKTQPKPQPEYTNYEEELEEEEQDLEDVNYDYKKDKVAVEYEAAKQHAFVRSSLEETMDVNKTDIKFGKFKVFEAEVQTNLAAKYLSDFYDPEGLKKAVVMSEILQRKF